MSIFVRMHPQKRPQRIFTDDISWEMNSQSIYIKNIAAPSLEPAEPQAQELDTSLFKCQNYQTHTVK